MAKAKDADDTAGVDAFMATLDHPLKAQVEMLRAIIRKAEPSLNERIKWKAPSFFLGANDFAAFNLHQTEFVQLIVIFPQGRGAIDVDGLLEGEWIDRRIANFSASDIDWKANKLTRLVRDWVKLATDRKS